jgi:hypothetical protein
MAEETEEIVLGTFTAQDNSDRDGVEIRLHDEKHNGNGVFRHGSLRGKFERGAVYEVVARLKSPTPEEKTVTATIPAEERSQLPAGAEIVEQSSGVKPKKAK